MEALIDHFLKCITHERKALFEELIQKRTTYLTVVLENIYQPLNASAVLRSCDCFGIQDVHVIENYNEFKPDREVAMGASNWLTVNRYDKNENNTLDCIQSLKNKGYRIVATSPHNSQTGLINFDLSKGKTALFFGTEVEGLSDVVLENADEHLHIPMYGFTESFNLSVSAAICLYEMRMKMEKENIKWHMTEDEKNQVLLNWLRYSIDRSEIVEEDFLKNRLGC
ncbi:MAG: TrmH family RNA methyltransferase [Flavobacteriia bacterium]|nr:TrmH family RNA methyltransferase [Flavobacteriia bacterium]